jgi:hypothetical protein
MMIDFRVHGLLLIYLPSDSDSLILSTSITSSPLLLDCIYCELHKAVWFEQFIIRLQFRRVVILWQLERTWGRT